MKVPVVLLMLFALTLLTTLPGESAVVPLSVQELTLDSTVVIRGVVRDKDVHYSDDARGQLIVSDFDVSVLEVLKKGAATELPGRLLVEVEGGRIGNIAMRNNEAPLVQLGEEVVMFLKPHSHVQGAWLVYGCFQGKLTILDGMVREAMNQSWSDLRQEILGHVRNSGK